MARASASRFELSKSGERTDFGGFGVCDGFGLLGSDSLDETLSMLVWRGDNRIGVPPEEEISGVATGKRKGELVPRGLDMPGGN